MIRYSLFKRVLDVFFACLLIVFLAPVFLISALAIKLESGGPVIFKQMRPGKDGKIFPIYKFRTMITETKKNGILLSDMDRLTRIGKILRNTSVDELPQLFNIIKGEMSFIGPRPLLVEYLDRYTPRQKCRHNVMPGITGWAQINGRNAISWDEKFENDLYYIDNVSFVMDMKIFARTLLIVLRRVNVNFSKHITMEKMAASRFDTDGISQDL